MKLIRKAPSGVLIMFAALVLGGLIAACGSASSSGSATSSSSTTASAAATGGTGTGPNSARRAALTACLKQHGVTLPARPAGAPPAGGSGGTGTGTNRTGTTPRRGFFFGGGGGGRGFASNPKLRAALQACGAKFGGGRGFTGRISHATITKYVTCVRQHGYNLPNPNFSGKGPVFPANIQKNAKFQAASRACQSILAPPRPSGGTSTTSGA